MAWRGRLGTSAIECSSSNEGIAAVASLRASGRGLNSSPPTITAKIAKTMITERVIESLRLNLGKVLWPNWPDTQFTLGCARSARQMPLKKIVEPIPIGWPQSQPRCRPKPNKQRRMRAFDNPQSQPFSTFVDPTPSWFGQQYVFTQNARKRASPHQRRSVQEFQQICRNRRIWPLRGRRKNALPKTQDAPRRRFGQRSLAQRCPHRSILP